MKPTQPPRRNEEASTVSPDSVMHPDWQAALQGDHDAFQRIVAPYLDELLRAARREVRYRVALGDLGRDDLSPEELVGEVLVRAWRDRRRRPESLSVRVWLLALVFRVAESIARREARFRKVATVSLEAPVPPEPIYDDDEEFWEWYQPDEMTRWEDVVEDIAWSPEELAEGDEDIARLPYRMRQVFVLHDIHGVKLPDVARAAGVDMNEALRLLNDARRRVRRAATGDAS
jgi:RNA polymerase sigma factor (sigma-70 family)